MNLTSLQEHFSSSLLSAENDPELLTTFSNAVEEHSARFAIYRNNVTHSLTTALGDLYPTVKKLVGDDFFLATATAYIRSNPPQQAAMVWFGESFPEFLSKFEHTRSLPYLSDVAKLELCRHQSYHAPDAQPLGADFFRDWQTDALVSAHAIMHPACRILGSQFPILTIWQTNQEDDSEDGDIHLDQSEYVLIHRPYYEVDSWSVDRGTICFLEALKQQQSIGQALEQAMLSDDHFDPSAAVAHLIEKKLLIDIIGDKAP